jgi:dipeptidyl aminopeptidase/acylaminoacyl peptidase
MISHWRSLTLAAALIASLAPLSPAAPPTLSVPDTIKADGVPPIPASLSEALNRYQNIRSATFQDWASDGQGMYILTRFADVPQVHWVAGPGAARTQLTFLPERVLSVSARPKHDQFLYSIDKGGAENYQLFLMDRKTGDSRLITDGNSRNMAPEWSPSGELLAWSSNARNGRDMDLYISAPADPHFRRLFKQVTGQWTVADWSPDETKVAAVEYISINEAYIHLVDVSTGATQTITPLRTDPKAEPVAAVSPKFSKDGKFLLYLTDKGSEFRQLVRHDLASGNVQVLTKTIPWDIEEFAISDNGSIALVANQNGLGKVYMYTAESRDGSLPPSLPENACQLVPNLPDGLYSGLKFMQSIDYLGYTFSSARGSSDAYSIEAKKPDISRWTTSELGGLNADTFAEPELIQFPSFDTRKIPAFLYRPPASKFPGPRPVLINIHGGPESQYRPAFLGRLNYLINDLGLVLIFPNVRGSAGYGKTYVKLDNGNLRADSVKDIGALLDWIATQPSLDKTRVGVIGGSYGGFMSLAVQTTYNDRIKAGIDIVGISNFVTFLQNTQGYRRDLRRAEYGDERDPRMRSYLEQISPLSSASKIHTPILVVQGQNDPRVPLSEAEQMVAALKQNGVPLWYIIGTNEGHGFAKKVNQDYLQAAEVLFLKRFLIGNAEADPKADNPRERFPVSGKVTFEGQLIADGTITFHPIDPSGHPASGPIKNGSYSLSTRVPNDGALPGQYKVTIDPSSPRYKTAETTPLTARIAATATVIDFDIK